MRGILQREMSGYEEKEIRIKGSGSNSRELENSRNESCRCTWFSNFYIKCDHLYHSFTFKELPWCADVLVSVCLALKDSCIHLTEERKTFGLMFILALLIFRQHQFPPFPRDLGNCNVSQLPIFGKICRGKENIKCLSHSLQKNSESRTKPYSSFKNLQILAIFVFEVKVK